MDKISERQKRELRAIARLKDEEIETSDIPEIQDWSGAIVGRFYRPAQQAVTLRLDADVLAWLKSQGTGYQARINRLLRQAMDQELAKSPPAKEPRPHRGRSKGMGG